VADIFVSYTSSDRDWAFWIGQELLKLGHAAHLHEWEIGAGGDISRWIEERHDNADHILCVVSEAYLKAPYSSWERRAAQWAATSERPNFAVPVFVESCKAPTLLAPIKRCDLHGLSEDQARARLGDFLKPAGKPTGPLSFPGAKRAAASGAKPSARALVMFPGKTDSTSLGAISNIPITVPFHFLGRGEDLATIDAALQGGNGRAAITALHGLRGVGKTTLAAAYAEQRCDDYRATWWIRAQTETTTRADLVGLGIRLGWIETDEKEEPALAAVMERLRDDGDGILLVYDNANNSDEIRKYLPRGGAAQIIVTSNAPNWHGIAAPVEIEVWPKEVGAEYLVAGTGRDEERKVALVLSKALEGLPLVHVQAAAYCDRLGVSLADYHKRFEATPVALLDDQRDAAADYYDGRSVAKTFVLAIEEAAKLHPAAEPLIVYAALLAPEPIPLFLFSEAREKFGEPLATTIVGDGLDEAVAALRAFALVDRVIIADERDPSIATECIRLHRLVREVAAALRAGEQRDKMQRDLLAALAAVYPGDGYKSSVSWPRSGRLTPHLIAICEIEIADADASEERADLLGSAGSYSHGRGTYLVARSLLERALSVREKLFGSEHRDTATSLNNLALLLGAQGDLARARPLHERALAILEKLLGPEHPRTATSLNNLAGLMMDQGDLVGARPLLERALAISERVQGIEHHETAESLNNLGSVIRDQGDFTDAQPLFERALVIYGKSPEPRGEATTLSNLGLLFYEKGDFAGAQSFFERAVTIFEKALGPDHPDTATSLSNLGLTLQARGDLAGARPYYERSLIVCEKALGPHHSDTARALNILGVLLREQGNLAGAWPYYERALAIYEKTLGADHPNTALSLNNLGDLLRAQGDLAGARPYFERALAISEKARGSDHPDTAISLNSLSCLLQEQGDLAGARRYCERALAICEMALGAKHRTTKIVARNTARVLEDLEFRKEAKAMRQKFGIED
jgi:tetratricopeptide (TPR) repeat protein